MRKIQYPSDVKREQFEQFKLESRSTLQARQSSLRIPHDCWR
jgi:hypothetical protein